MSLGRLEPTQLRSWVLLGDPWAPFGGSFSLSWDLLGLSWALQGASRGHLEALAGALRRKSVKCQKPLKTLWKKTMFLGGRGFHDAAKIGPKSGNLGSRWRLEAILKRG